MEILDVYHCIWLNCIYIYITLYYIILLWHAMHNIICPSWIQLKDHSWITIFTSWIRICHRPEITSFWDDSPLTATPSFQWRRGDCTARFSWFMEVDVFTSHPSGYPVHTSPTREFHIDNLQNLWSDIIPISRCWYVSGAYVWAPC